VFDIVEGNSFSYPLELYQGSTPVEWSLVGLPISGMSIDLSSGMLSWEYPVAKSELFSVKVQATNDLGRSALIQLVFRVTPSYYVTLFPDISSYTRPAPPVSFYIVTRDLITGKLVGDKLAVLWLYEHGKPPSLRRKITVKTNALGKAQLLYQPYSTDAGLFLYGGEHPSYSNLTVQGQLQILGIDVIPGYYYYQGLPLETKSIGPAFTIQFKGGEFSGIEALVGGDVADVSIQPFLSSTTAGALNDTVKMSLEISVNAPLTGKVYFTISTAQGATASSYVYLDVRPRAPKIAIIPHVVDVEAVSGGNPTYHDITLQNIGSMQSDIIEIITPPQDIMTPPADYLPSLAVDEIAVVSFQVLIPDDATVGTVFSGTVGFSSSSYTVPLDYRIVVAPSVPAVLTIITQNEATFFSDEKHNLENADVRVRSLSLGSVYRGNSGSNGTIVFDNLLEDFYEIIVQKQSHGAFRKTVFLEAPGQIVEAFLQFEAVSYTFSVVPIPVTDKYEIIVETTFTTRKLNPVDISFYFLPFESYLLVFILGSRCTKASHYLGPDLP
jgi:hypothetical protein